MEGTEPPTRQVFVQAKDVGKSPLASTVMELANFDYETKQFLKENNVVELGRGEVSVIRLGVDIMAVLELLKQKNAKILAEEHVLEQGLKGAHRGTVKEHTDRVAACQAITEEVEELRKDMVESKERLVEEETVLATVEADEVIQRVELRRVEEEMRRTLFAFDVKARSLEADAMCGQLIISPDPAASTASPNRYAAGSGGGGGDGEGGGGSGGGVSAADSTAHPPLMRLGNAVGFIWRTALAPQICAMVRVHAFMSLITFYLIDRDEKEEGTQRREEYAQTRFNKCAKRRHKREWKYSMKPSVYAQGYHTQPPWMEHVL